jgi:heme/copper-type cytochrome/quinol oxidase subunit 4
MGIFFICLGVFGLLLGLVLRLYAYKKHDAGWDIAAHDTAGRGILILIVGILILIFAGTK